MTETRNKMLDKKKIAALRTRIKKANSSLNCMGALMLGMEIDSWDMPTCIAVHAALLEGKSPVSFKYLLSHSVKLKVKRERVFTNYRYYRRDSRETTNETGLAHSF